MLSDPHKKLREKLREALTAVLPIICIMLLLCFSIAPVSPGILLSFLTGAALIIIGIMFFTIGAELSMTPMGERVGAAMTRKRSLALIIALGFLLGFIITISEPDLQVLAGQVPSVPNLVLILSVAVGVGVFLVAALLRMLFGVSLRLILIISYAVVFVLAAFVPKSFLAVAFDSGGVTTGPMTVPFIMALGIGVSSIRSDSRAGDDSFGLIALCSVGPIIAVMTLGLIYPTQGKYAAPALPDVGSSTQLAGLFLRAIPDCLKEIGGALIPIAVFFGIFQAVTLKLPRRSLYKIIIGLVYTYVGLALFLTGANVGFMPAGNYLGQTLASLHFRWLIVPVGMVIGYFIVKAEPAVYVLNKQVEEMTDGAVSSAAMGTCLSVGVSVSIGLSLIRVLTGISILWFILPGYLTALALSFCVPRIFTAIAFDSGGVASGPMTATFLLPFAQGACLAAGGDIVADAFGVVAMVAMTPLITIQVMGLTVQIKKKLAGAGRRLPAAPAYGKPGNIPGGIPNGMPSGTPVNVPDIWSEIPDDAIIEL